MGETVQPEAGQLKHYLCKRHGEDSARTIFFCFESNVVLQPGDSALLYVPGMLNVWSVFRLELQTESSSAWIRFLPTTFGPGLLDKLQYTPFHVKSLFFGSWCNCAGCVEVDP